MLGMVFTELLEMVEAGFSPELADRVIERAALPNGGAYTAVGHYPHEEIVRLVGALAEETGLPAADLVRAFGQHLFRRFTVLYPEVFVGTHDVFGLLARLDGDIHVTVRRLYPDATLPRFHVVSRDERHLRLAYESPRRMEILAVGLIEGAIDHFGGGLTLRWEEGRFEDRPAVLFDVERTD